MITYSRFAKALQDVLGLSDDFPFADAYHRFRYYSDWLSAQEDLSAVPEPDAVERMRRRRFELTMEEFGLPYNLDRLKNCKLSI